ncbi:MAG TPA: class II fumarate hydratase [Dehalococcoidia bacterium]|nr:class II fumarate hydratase [Dehalococcoidia bacterium]
MTQLAGHTRVERDSMGPMDVPSEALYGASTQRAVLNFPISDYRFPRRFIQALGQIKQSAAVVNEGLGLLDSRVAGAIQEAAQEVIDGRHDAQFPVDIFQTGSGTSTNMNANEVIANLASQRLGGQLGSKLVHPNDQVNLCQSSNDVIPTAMHLSGAVALAHDLIPALRELEQSLRAKSKEFWPVIKTGRTHLQDATPIRLGQEFLGFAGQVERGVQRLEQAQAELSEVALGGTAVGTGVNSHPEFAARVCRRLSELNGVAIRESSNHFQAQNTIDGVVAASGALRTVAVSLMKIANDIRWMGSGPRAGIGELALPEVQPGSSIMPGKVNPVIAEALIMACAQVIGHDETISVCGQWGYFELNTMLPVAAYDLLDAIDLLAKASANFARQCVEGLRATPRGPEMVERGLAICTSLAPVIGYDKAAAIAKLAGKTGRTIREVARDETDLTDAQLDEILNPEEMVKPGLEGGSAGG